MCITAKMRTESHSQDLLRMQNACGRNGALFTHRQRPALDRAEFKCMRHNIALVYRHTEEAYTEQTLGD